MVATATAASTLITNGLLLVLERVARSSDHENNECLHSQGFHEPSGVKKRLVGRSMKYPAQYPEDEEIIDRADRTDDRHDMTAAVIAICFSISSTACPLNSVILLLYIGDAAHPFG
ncbi:MAG TPA: hypothetical protein VFI72_18495 [Candidatus Angelobacter sp.]|nr:hypothetical protein [Candidatus Angelobacter sp.]